LQGILAIIDGPIHTVGLGGPPSEASLRTRNSARRDQATMTSGVAV